MEQPLEGGRTTVGVVRVGDTVRRPRGRRSVFVTHAVAWLNRRSYPYAPCYLGIDDQGRDTFAFVPGETTDHPTQRDESACATVAGMLRALHDLTRDADLVGKGNVLLHGDPGPFNTICRDGRPRCLIDWDSARPGDALEDVGYAAWTWCVQTLGRVPVEDQARRVREFRDGYDAQLPGDVVLDAMAAAQHRVISVERSVLQDEAATAARQKHAAVAIEWAAGDNQLLRSNLAAFQRALAP